MSQLRIGDPNGPDPIVLETSSGEPVILDGRVVTSVREIVAWAFANLPEVVSEARLSSLPRKDCCPPGFTVHTCPACKGRGFSEERTEPS